MKLFWHMLILISLAVPAAAAEKTVRLSVPGMTCVLCPLTVETAIGVVAGVKSVAADLATKSAVAVFDDAVTSAESLAQASGNAGYPATITELQ